jgi:hypothetical protein
LRAIKSRRAALVVVGVLTLLEPFVVLRIAGALVPQLARAVDDLPNVAAGAAESVAREVVRHLIDALAPRTPV